jgi:hydroxymethylpyrimidine/phosphomethylpyrimidine kinase
VRELLAGEQVVPFGDIDSYVADASLASPGCRSTRLRSHPSNLIRFVPAKGVQVPVPRCLTIAGSDSGGGAGIQADLKAFAAAGCHGTSAIVALTAQNTVGVSAAHEVPSEFVTGQLEAVFEDIGVDAAKTGMLFSHPIVEAVAEFLAEHPVPLVVDPVMVASSGAKLLEDDAIEALVTRLFPLATVVTPNLLETEALAGFPGSRRELAERIHELGAPAVVVTGGHGSEPIDHLFDGQRHVEIPVERYDVPATHGAGCTHSATLAALLAHGYPLVEAARGAAVAAASAVRNGLTEIGRGEGPVDVLNVKERDAGLSRADTARAARA